MSTPNKPLTDEEIARKFGIATDDPHFDTAKALSRNRPDRTFCDIPMLQCPHCGQEFQWDDYYDVDVGSKIDCPKCERVIYVDTVDHRIHVTLTTEEPT